MKSTCCHAPIVRAPDLDGWMCDACCHHQLPPNPTDTDRLDKIERLLWSAGTHEGLAFVPLVNSQTRERRIAVQDLENETLGDELTPITHTLRDAIDALTEDS